MSKALGPRTFGKREEMVFLGREMNEERDYGDHIAEEIDHEVQRLITEGYEEAQQILIDNKPKLVQVAEYLIVHEAISGEDITKLFEDGLTDEGDQGNPATPPQTPPPATQPHLGGGFPHPAPSLSADHTGGPESN